MKKILFFLLAVLAMNAYSQTVTTTTINGSLRVNDSLNVSNNLQAADIRSRGEMVAQSNLKTDSDLFVNGNAEIIGELKVRSLSRLSGGIVTPGIAVGKATDYIGISMVTLTGGARVLSFGSAPIKELPTTCIKPYSSSLMSIFSDRAGVISSNSANMLDFNNDGQNGYIDYGYDISLYSQGSGSVTPIPALKLNSHCYGDVEIARGGGVLAAGNYLEIGSPSRNNGIALNVKAPNRIGQRITVISLYLDSNPVAPDAYNTQLFVNRNKIKALTVFNTVTNSSGDETFVVYGNGKTHIGIGRPLTTGVCANAMLTVDGTILAKEVRVAISTSTHWADYVFDKGYKLMPLKEVEAFIQSNKHLPEVPSSADVEKNGIDVTEISATLLKKIEELTLYTIELQKKLEDQQKEINNLKKH